MIKKSTLLVVVLSSITFFSGCAVPFAQNEPDSRYLSNQETDVSAFSKLPDRSFASILIADQQLTVEVVSSPQSLTQGLSGRSEIGADGMLFVFPNQQPRVFWMKDMQFPIDIIWIDSKEVVGIESNVLPPNPETPDEELARYGSKYPVRYVLELPAGKAEELGIEVLSTMSLVQE